LVDTTAPTGVAQDVTEVIGRTPIVRLGRYHAGPRAGIFAKLEFMNPGGSVKDRMALAMIRDAEERGLLRPGGTIIEPTAGNTGIGLAIVAAVRGYRTIVVVPERFSIEKQTLMRALGATIVSSPTSEGIEGAIARAQNLAARTPGSFVPQQFANPANVHAHYTTTGVEIWEQMQGRVDVAVIGAGTGGTFTGVVRALRERHPGLYAVLVQPYGACLGRPPNRAHKIEGIGVDCLETVPVLDPSLADEVLVVRDEEAHAAVQELARTEGLLVGSSAGAAAHAAREVARRIEAGEQRGAGRILTIFPDSSERYLSKHIHGTFEEWQT
jgi:O-acetylserine dependent cystathionine beta-synthase